MQSGKTSFWQLLGSHQNFNWFLVIFIIIFNNDKQIKMGMWKTIIGVVYINRWCHTYMFWRPKWSWMTLSINDLHWPWVNLVNIWHWMTFKLYFEMNLNYFDSEWPSLSRSSETAKVIQGWKWWRKTYHRLIYTTYGPTQNLIVHQIMK